jgi:ribosomal protein L37AE/L43A
VNAMAKKKSRSEVEYLRGLIRQQLKEIKKLKKQNNRNTKRKVAIDSWEVPEQEEQPKVLAKNKCPKCNSEDVKTLNLGIKKILVCNECNFRKTITNGNR